MKRSATQSDVLGNLVAERQKFEQWIAALEEKKGSTPPKVYERVHADYTSRLASVMEELGARSAELESQRNSLRERSDDLSAQETALREERAEAELRNMVGEYSPQQWKDVSKSSDAGISKIASERSAVDAELESLNKILGSMSGSSAKGESAVPPKESAAAPKERAAPPKESAAPPKESEAVAPDPKPAEEAKPAAPATAPSASPAATRQTPAVGTASAPASPPRAPTPSRSVAGTPLGFPATSSAPPASAASSDRAPASPAPRSVPATPLETPSEGAAPGTRPHRPSFDELSFLKSVAPGSAKDKAAPPSNNSAEGSDSKSPAAADGPSQSPVAPLRPTRQVNASDVGAVGIENLSSAKNETPAFLKNVPSEQTKTLKCAECNAMNYATEWYCERCGAELSAL